MITTIKQATHNILSRLDWKVYKTTLFSFNTTKRDEIREMKRERERERERKRKKERKKERKKKATLIS